MSRTGRAFRRILTLSAALGLCPVYANAAEPFCQSYNAELYHEEWVAPDTQQHGARLVNLDPRWQFAELGYHATAKAVCRSCPAGQLAQAVLWLRIRDGAGEDLDEELAVENIENHMAGFPYHAHGAKFVALEGPVFATFAGHDGRARAVRIEFPDGKVAYVVAAVMSEQCASLFGILHAAGGSKISVHDLSSFNSAIRLEMYKPGPDARASEIIAKAQNPNLQSLSLEAIHRSLTGGND